MLKTAPSRSRLGNLLKQGSGRDELELAPLGQLDLRRKMRLGEVESYYFVETDRGHIE